jgi:hypothetical protein
MRGRSEENVKKRGKGASRPTMKESREMPM